MLPGRAAEAKTYGRLRRTAARRGAAHVPAGFSDLSSVAAGDVLLKVTNGDLKMLDDVLYDVADGEHRNNLAVVDDREMSNPVFGDKRHALLEWSGRLNRDDLR